MQNLLELEQEDLYVFHGSGLKLPRLEPRQAYTLVNQRRVPDGEPAVHASTFLDYAIFIAIINPENCPRGVRASCDYLYGKLLFGATVATLDQVTEDSFGYVHVLRRTDFVQRNHSEWVSYKPVEPMYIFDVKWTDLKREVSIIEDAI